MILTEQWHVSFISPAPPSVACFLLTRCRTNVKGHVVKCKREKVGNHCSALL